MESSSEIILTSPKYFQMNFHMEDLLRSKGLESITLRIKHALHDASKKSKWYNKNDSAYGLLRMSISTYLQFHLQIIDTLVQA